MGRGRILVIGPEERVRDALVGSLREEGFDAGVATSAAGLDMALMTFAPDAVLARIGERGEGPEMVRVLRARWCDAALVAVVEPERVDLAVEAMRAGADSYVTTPLERAVAALILEKVLEGRRMRHDAGALRDEVRRRRRIVGEGPEIQAVQDLVRRAAPTTAPLLVQGETGTGRALMAETLHEASPRRDRPFVRVRCAGVSEALLAAELFGHERGALGCADERRDGALHSANGGTLFLQEVSRLPPSVQVNLLRVLQTGEVERVGATETTAVDVRFVASSTCDLADEVRAGRFREDLYYRLHVVSIALPPLRERKGDIPALVAHFLALASAEQHKDVRTISPGALSALFAYAWPGNVRELRRTVEDAVAACCDQELLAEHLPPVLHGSAPDARAESALIPGATLFEIEREAILRTLDEVGGSTVRAAHVLGISVRKVQYRLKEYRRGHLTSPRAVPPAPSLARAAG